MITAEFEYERVSSVAEAVSALVSGGDDAKLLAGGHSLVPLMKLRLAAPGRLIDISRVPGLSSVERDGALWRIGALCTHARLSRSGAGLISQVAATIADPQVRNRGTIGGSLAHGDPASDLPAAILALDGSVVAHGPQGERTIPAAEFFSDYMETALGPAEMVCEVLVPAMDGYGFGYEKFNRRAEDWAVVAVAAAVKVVDGACADVRVALTNMGPTPLRAAAVEAGLRGQPTSEESIRAAAAHAADDTDPPADLDADADYKRHLATVLCERALRAAVGVA